MFSLIIDCLATYRITRLIIEDEILTEPREAILEHLDPDGKPAYLLSCPWCVSPYVAIGVVACRAFAPRLWHPVATVLALSAAAGYISEH